MDGPAREPDSTLARPAIPAAGHGPARPPLRLNLFQRLVRQWDHLHPYNAAQAMKLAGPIDPAALRAAWHDALDRLGLGKVRVAGRSYWHECLNGEAQTQTVRWLADGSDLSAHLSAELNRPFDAEDSVPFRPFALRDGPDVWAGVVYQHWVADSVSIRTLLREWFLCQFDPAAASRRPARSGGGYGALFGPLASGWELGGGLLSSARWCSRFRRVRRVDGGASADFRTAFSAGPVLPGIVGRLRDGARRRGVTVNDVLLAAIADACHRFGPMKRSSRRTDVALGSIVDLRPQVNGQLTGAFGLYLGFTSVVCQPKSFREFEHLLQRIAAQTRSQKDAGVAAASTVRMLAGLAAGQLLSKDGVARFYRKRVPLAGGISNVNLNSTWVAKYHPTPLLDYLRVSPTGPMMPLVFTATTLGQDLALGLTRRLGLVDPDRAKRIVDRVASQLDAFE